MYEHTAHQHRATELRRQADEYRRARAAWAGRGDRTSRSDTTGRGTGATRTEDAGRPENSARTGAGAGPGRHGVRRAARALHAA